MAKPKDKTCAEIFQVLKILHPEPYVVELRALRTRKGIRSGYFNDMKKLASEAVRLKEEPGIYVTLNACDPALLSRSLNHLTDYVRQTTADADIVQRRWFPVDIDPVRPKRIPSTDQEHQAALERGYAIKKYLSGEGWPDPLHVQCREDSPAFWDSEQERRFDPRAPTSEVSSLTCTGRDERWSTKDCIMHTLLIFPMPYLD